MMRHLLLCSALVSVSAHAVLPPGGSASAGQFRQADITRLIVKPSGGPVTAANGVEQRAARAAFVQQAALNATGLQMQVLRHLATDALVVELQGSVTLQQAEEYADWIARQPGIEYAEPDRIKRAALTPNDTFYSGYQGHLKAPADGGAGAANLPGAWDITTGGSDIVVSVIDTGARDHVDLQNRFVGGSVAASGRDFISYYSGYTYLPVDGDGRDGDPTDPGDWTNGTYCSPGDSSWHGMHVAGTIGAETNNNLHVAGIDWQAKLLTARVLGRCGGFTSDIADAMIWSAGATVDGVANPNPARVLNLSLGGGGACSTTEQNAIDAAVAQGAVVVVAAGNENRNVVNSSPANCDNVVTVAAVDSSNGARAWFSNYGAKVEIAAPGVSIASTINSGSTTPVAEDGNASNQIGDITDLYHGTSMATPHVSGVVALMLAANQAAGGDLMAEARKAETSSRITAKLQASARAFPSGTGNDCTTALCGAGLLDGHQAVVAVSTAPTVNAGGNQSVSGGANVTLSASVSDDAYSTTTTWQWTQTSGSTVTLNNADAATASFTAPATNETLTFTVTATDDTGLTGTDSVDVQVSTGSADTTPDAFTFADQTDVALSTPIVSAPITVSGINAATAISVTGGEYSVNGGTYTGAAGTVNNGNTVRVRHTSSSAFSTAVNTVLTIGGVSDAFTSTTLAASDTTPDAFSFVDQTDVALSATITSNAIIVSGIDAATAISVTGGQYSVSGGAYTGASGTVNDGDTVRVQHTSSANHATSVNTVLTIGGVSDTFTSTTLAGGADDTVPDAFQFIDQSDVARKTYIVSNTITVSGITASTSISLKGNGHFSVNGGAYTRSATTVNNGDTVTVRHRSSAHYASPVHTVLTIGGVSDTFTTTTEARPDATPDAFSFVDQSDVARKTTLVSNTITVSGIAGAASISLKGNGYFSVNGGAYTRSATTVNNGDTVTVRHRSSAHYASPVHTVLTIGGVSDTFTTTTEARPDATPDAFSFVDQSDVVRRTTFVSNTITVSGIAGSASISLKGNGYFSVNGGGYTRSATTVNNGDTVTVRHRSSAHYASPVHTVLTIGGVSDTFTTTTEASSGALPNAPDAFSFVDRTDVARRTWVTSNAITVSGLNGSASISMGGTGVFSVNGGSYRRRSTTVNNGDTVTVRYKSSSYYSTPVHGVVTIGGVSDTFTTTTQARPDTTPDAFSFVDQSDVARKTTLVSNTIVVSGIDGSASVSIGGSGVFSVNGGSYRRRSTTVSNGDTVTVRQKSSSHYSTSMHSVLTIGGVSDTFTTTTEAASDTTPDAFSFVDQTDVARGVWVVSDPITVSGIDGSASISIGGTGVFNVNGGAYRRRSTTVNDGDVVTVRYKSSSYYSTPVHGVVTIGGVSDTFTTTTAAQP